MKPDDELFSNLNQHNVSQDTIGNAYCSHMVKRGECPRLRNRGCVACLHRLAPVFEVALDEVDNKEALIIWRLSKLGKGELSIHTSMAKEQIRPYHKYVDPIQKLKEMYT